MSGPADPIKDLEAQIGAHVAAREKLAPFLHALIETVPGAADYAVVVTFEPIPGTRVPVVISTDRLRVSTDLAAWCLSVERQHRIDRKERPG